MKHTLHKAALILVTALVASYSGYSQDKNVGIGTTTPDKSSILDISSSNKGFLMPRMTLMQRNNIKDPAEGLIVFQTDISAGFYYYNGTGWQSMEAKSVTGTDGDWTTIGNAGMTSSNFIGTTDVADLIFKVNNQKSGVISATGLTFIGYKSGESNNGDRNTGIGYQALSLSTGNDNVALGHNALAANTTGLNNVGVGSSSLLSNTTGYNNVGVGIYTLLGNTTGINNMAIGGASLSSNTTGSFNTGVGVSTLSVNTTGDKNMAVGTSALAANTTGTLNVGIGVQALFSNTTGSKNIAIGSDAGFSNINGTGNLFIGSEAGFNETANNKLYIANSSTTTPLIYGDFSAKYVTIGDVTPALRNQGVASGGYNLLVKGGILTEKVKVALAAPGTDWADYVFEPEYNLMPLENVEAFTKENKHLPNVPSAIEMVENGLDVSQSSKMFMEKIEELTLYLIEMNKEIKSLKGEVLRLQQK
jgi:hypothetical protein